LFEKPPQEVPGVVIEVEAFHQPHHFPLWAAPPLEPQEFSLLFPQGGEEPPRIPRALEEFQEALLQFLPRVPAQVCPQEVGPQGQAQELQALVEDPAPGEAEPPEEVGVQPGELLQDSKAQKAGRTPGPPSLRPLL